MIKILTILILVSIYVNSTALLTSNHFNNPTLYEFISESQKLWGTSKEFVQRFKFSYRDVYNDQLQYNIMNAYLNQLTLKQMQAGTRSVQLKNQKLTHYTIIQNIIVGTLIILIVIFLLKILCNE